MEELEFKPGKQIAGRYTLLGVIGRGATSVVYKALDNKLNRNVALKIIPRRESLEERVKREIKIAAGLNHPAIVHLYDFLSSDKYYIVIMELVEGISLRKLLVKKKKIPWDKATYIAVQLASALEEAHSKQIIHRDIKPENVLITKDGKVKLADFGIAALIQRSKQIAVSGTPGYMAPEQITGKYLDETADIYSLGVVLYEMLTGTNPFVAEDFKEAVHRALNLNPVEPHLVDPSVPKKLSDIVMKAMAKDPDFRFQSAAALTKALLDFQKEYLELKKKETSLPEETPRTKKPDYSVVFLRALYTLSFFYLLLTATPLTQAFGGSAGTFITLALVALGLFNPQAANIVAYLGISALALSTNISSGLFLLIAIGIFLFINSTYQRNLIAPLAFLEIKTVAAGIYPFSPYLLIVIGDEAAAFSGSLTASIIAFIIKLHGGLSNSPYFLPAIPVTDASSLFKVLELLFHKPVLILELLFPAVFAYMSVVTARSIARKQRFGNLTSILTFTAANLFGYQVLSSVFKLDVNIGRVFALSIPGLILALILGATFNLLKQSHEVT